MDGQVRLGLRPRQLTFVASAQPDSSSRASFPHPQLPVAAAAPANALPASMQAQEQSAVAVPAAAQGSVLGFSQTLNHQQSLPVSIAAGPGFGDSQSLPTQPSQPLADASLAQQSVSVAPNIGIEQQQQQVSVAYSEALQQAGVESQQAPSASAEAGSTELSESPPSLAWPGAVAAPLEPIRQQSILSAVPSRQASGAVLPLSRQLSAVAPVVSGQPSAVVQVLSRQATAQQLPSGESPAAAQVPSRQSSAMGPSRQASTAATPPTRQTSAVPASQPASLPAQAAAGSPGQGLQQHAQQDPHTQGVAPSVRDILQMWAPVPKPPSTGTLIRFSIPKCMQLFAWVESCKAQP